jgi:tRNA pseudouridine55 synthase
LQSGKIKLKAIMRHGKPEGSSSVLTFAFFNLHFAICTVHAMPSGLLLVDKPEGPTSAHVVERVKRILGAKKVGHLGTLDPFASGLLPLGIDDGTKIAEIFLTAQKSYQGVIALGVETDTQDSTGKVIETREVPVLADPELEKLRQAFSGALMQTPPMFSALKKDGVRLYRLARKGQTVDRAPREI